MTGSTVGHERVYRALLRLCPAAFRVRFSDEMVQLFRDQLRDASAEGATAGAARTWLGALADLAVTAVVEHARGGRQLAHSMSAPPSVSSRVLGLAGILGGGVLLAALLVEIDPDLNQFRILLFNVGAMAIAVAVYRRQASVARTLALLATVPLFVVNGWYLVMVALAIGRPNPLGAEFAQVWTLAAAAMWLSDAWFGLVALRLGAVSRMGALALAIGSLLAFLPVVRIGLMSAEDPAIVTPLGLAGIALNGIGWIILGIDVGTRRRPAGPPVNTKGTDAREVFDPAATPT